MTKVEPATSTFGSCGLQPPGSGCFLTYSLTKSSSVYAAIAITGWYYLFDILGSHMTSTASARRSQVKLVPGTGDVTSKMHVS
jgi:hypothetical protein